MTETDAKRLWGAVYLFAALMGLYFALLSPIRFDTPTIGDLFYLSVLGLHALWGIALAGWSRHWTREGNTLAARAPEFLFSYGFLLFWILYAFASNANMDYVQRFMESGGELDLALDAASERLTVAVRFLPFLIASAADYLLMRVRAPRRIDRAVAPARSGRLLGGGSGAASGGEALWRRVVRQWALPLALLSSALSGFALPSFLAEDGLAALGWFAMVPLFLVFATTGFWGGLFYGMVYGLFWTVLTNYWLATFSLVSLQFAVLVFIFFYGVFLPLLMFVYHRAPRWRVLILPLGWTVFEYFRSSGFLGYPWGLTAHSQYGFTSFIQVAGITGVWGVSFLIILVNAILSRALERRLDRAGTPWLSLGATAAAIALIAYLGSASMVFDTARHERAESPRQVRVALIQQNSDPRKHQYERTLRSLQELTDQALQEDPDIVFWSETAFVPNIRRWGAMDPGSGRYPRLVNRFREYQESINTWLVTGNDDYEVIRDEEGSEIDRLNYNAAVLFDDEGVRRNTYRKIKLVPFTEYFPYQETLPWVYKLLLEFDTHFWEPGEERTVFEHRDFTFSTPICFEDVFPGEVRNFVRSGAQVIANLSNDYWSLTPVQAKQHFVAGVFRAAENRRPIVRATASGVTAHVDRFGRIQATVPTYSEEYLVADVTVPPENFTIYTRFGDWFPLASGLMLLVILTGSVFSRGRFTPGKGRRQ
mgnify:CR=1 FL=1